MTTFEKDTLRKLLCMAQKELRENGASFMGEALEQEKIDEYSKMIEQVNLFVGFVDLGGK